MPESPQERAATLLLRELLLRRRQAVAIERGGAVSPPREELPPLGTGHRVRWAESEESEEVAAGCAWSHTAVLHEPSQGTAARCGN